MNEHTQMNDLIRVIFVERHSEDRITSGITDTFILRKSLSSVLNAAKDFANPEHWQCIESFIWKNPLINALYVKGVLIKGPI
jgi:hypothetical protein